MSRILLAGGALLLVVGLALGGFQLYQRVNRLNDQAQVELYTEHIIPFASSAGKLARETIQIEMNDYVAGSISGAKVSADASNWLDYFAKTRAGFAGAPRPPALNPVAQLFDQALAEYVQAIRLFQQEAGSDPGNRSAAIGPGQAAWTKADGVWAQALQDLACQRTQIGLADRPGAKDWPFTATC